MAPSSRVISPERSSTSVAVIAPVGHRTQAVGQQRVADAGAKIVEDQLRDVEPPRRLQRRQAGRAHGLGDDAAGHELDVGRVEHAVVVGEPDAGDGDRRVLQDQLDHLVGGLDVRQCGHHRRAAIELAGTLDPAEGHERRLVEAALGERQVLAAAAAGGAAGPCRHSRTPAAPPLPGSRSDARDRPRPPRAWQAGRTASGKRPQNARQGQAGRPVVLADLAVLVAVDEHLGCRHGAEAKGRRLARPALPGTAAWRCPTVTRSRKHWWISTAKVERSKCPRTRSATSSR